MHISYNYTATTGTTLSVVNTPMGQSQSYTMECATSYGGKQIHFSFASVMVPKLSMDFKNEDFTISDLDFQAVADASGSVAKIYFS